MRRSSIAAAPSGRRRSVGSAPSDSEGAVVEDGSEDILNISVLWREGSSFRAVEILEVTRSSNATITELADFMSHAVNMPPDNQLFCCSGEDIVGLPILWPRGKDRGLLQRPEGLIEMSSAKPPSRKTKSGEEAVEEEEGDAPNGPSPQLPMSAAPTTSTRHHGHLRNGMTTTVGGEFHRINQWSISGPEGAHERINPTRSGAGAAGAAAMATDVSESSRQTSINRSGYKTYGSKSSVIGPLPTLFAQGCDAHSRRQGTSTSANVSMPSTSRSTAPAVTATGMRRPSPPFARVPGLPLSLQAPKKRWLGWSVTDVARRRSIGAGMDVWGETMCCV